jgi:hypothetical protein
MANAVKPVANDFETDLEQHIRAGYQVLYIPTSEEMRVEKAIRYVAAHMTPPMTVATWDCFEMFVEDKKVQRSELKDIKFRNPIAALEAIMDEKMFDEKQIFIFRDLDDYMMDAQVRRRIRTMTESNRLVNSRIRRPLIILSPKLQIHEKLRTSMTVIDFKLPDATQHKNQIEFIRRSIQSSDPSKKEVSPELQESLSTNLLGLTSMEAENCLSRCLVRHGGFSPDMLRTVKEEKAAIVKKSEVLTYIPEGSLATRDEIGGYDLYMDWLDRRKLAYTPNAIAQNVDFPKGCILLGLPGTGKSVVAKATCMVLGLPGYVLDIGSLFGSMVGESEQRTRDVLKQIDAQQGCVLVIDEADKALGNAHNSSGDSGVTRRVFGTILSWLAENQSKTFCIMTLNRTDGLPPELLRAGRFDAVFYTDLPTDEERLQILHIHLRKRGVDPASLKLSDKDWKEIVKQTKDYVGAELEEIVREARYRALAETGNATPTFEHLIEARIAVVPMTQRDKTAVEAIREFCADRAKPVTTPQSHGKAGNVNSRTVQIDN